MTKGQVMQMNVKEFMAELYMNCVLEDRQAIWGLKII